MLLTKAKKTHCRLCESLSYSLKQLAKINFIRIDRFNDSL